MPEKKSNKKKHLVVLTGAGVSAESGLKTFRDSDGLWMGYNVDEVATFEGFNKNPKLVLDFYNMRRQEVAKVLPNAAHFGFAALEDKYDVSIITQNIDNLHERAGSSNVLHLHGEIFKMCSSLNKEIVLETLEDIKIGNLAADGSQLRPFIVWFGEPVPIIEIAIEIIKTADVFVIAGTSLQVYPAAGLVDYLSSDVPRYLIDPNPPSNYNLENIHVIKKTATKGVKELVSLLNLL